MTGAFVVARQLADSRSPAGREVLDEIADVLLAEAQATLLGTWLTRDGDTVCVVSSSTLPHDGAEVCPVFAEARGPAVIRFVRWLP